MGLTKQYLRYASYASWGLVASPNSNIVYLSNNLVVCPALEKVIIWDIRKNEKVCDTKLAKRKFACEGCIYDLYFLINIMVLQNPEIKRHFAFLF